MTNGGKDIHLMRSDIADWKITFVDTGLRANIGQRLQAVEKYLDGEEIFLANYSDGLTNRPLPEMIESVVKTGKIACFLCAKPPQSFHVVKLEADNSVRSIQSVRKSDIRINAGFFVFRKEIFKYIKPGEELVVEPFQRLIAEKKIIGYPSDQFWCMDTFKEHQDLTDMYNIRVTLRCKGHIRHPPYLSFTTFDCRVLPDLPRCDADIVHIRQFLMLLEGIHAPELVGRVANDLLFCDQSLKRLHNQLLARLYVFENLFSEYEKAGIDPNVGFPHALDASY